MNQNIEENQSQEEKLIQLEDKYIRLFADFENYKKRVFKEKEEIKNNTKISMLSSILEIDNDLSIAINNIKNPSAKKGIKLIINKVENFLKSHGIESIQTEKYDEDLHDVVSVIEGDEEKIIEVISKGYTLNGKPFKYPKIILSKLK
jgi:molecular chaperone GrpE